MPNIHATAIVDPKAGLAADVEVGPYCIVEPDVTIGAGTRLRSHVVLRRYTTLGADNLVDYGCVFGGEPQDFKFDPSTVTHLRIGDNNVFREAVTISRATEPGGATVVGNNTYWMVGSHAGHDCTVEDNVILVNNAGLAGHATVQQKALLSGHVIVHQFCWIGEMVMTEGGAAIRSHVPPYTLVVGRNRIFGLNVVGLRRAKNLTGEDRNQIKEAYGITYRSKLNAEAALAKMDECTDWGEAAGKFREFVRRVVNAKKPYDRGLCPARARAGGAD
jgi:UDP-N-acetylglucosamine acyltransferase